ncbi:MAG: alpha/beta fold hydrolase [Vicinamibacterales bacterium]
MLIPGALAWLFLRGQQVAELGDFHLERGGTIVGATIGYRTAGHLNAARSNAVLVLPWFQGTSGQIVWQIGPGRLVDTSKYFVIMADAFGNGVSSSPSTSRGQRGERFPEFTIGDIVESQYQLVTRVLRLQRLHAVVGISMGGMQVFQWTVAHPGFMDKAVSIVGSPQSQPDDRERWHRAIDRLRRPPWRRIREPLLALKPRAALGEIRIAPFDYLRQAQAIVDFDVTGSGDGSLQRTAARIRARLMIVSTWSDGDVNPAPAFELARLTHAMVLELNGRCGHQAPSCERKVLWAAVGNFLDQ